MSTFMYKDKPLAEPGNVEFGSADISGIGDGTVTGAISELGSQNDIKSVSIPINVGTTFTGTATLIKRNNIVTCKIVVENSSTYDISVGNIIFTIPEEFLPIDNFSFPALARDNGAWASANYYNFLISIYSDTGNAVIRGNETNLKKCRYMQTAFTYVAA